MDEKPKKRLVSRWEYLKILGKDMSEYTIGSLCLGVGSFFAWMAVGLFDSFWALHTEMGFYFLPLLSSCVAIWASCVGGAKFYYGWKLSNVRTVTLTTQNAYLLPPEESLVRPSDLPPSQQQAELLRAAQYGKETPFDQLLRATTKKK